MADRLLFKQVLALAKTQQFYWFLGHFFSIIFFVLQFFESFTSGIRFYRLCLSSIIFTYVIVIKQIHFKSRHTVRSISIKTLFKDENVQYLILSVWFYAVSFVIGKVNGSIYSFNIYLIFHILTYFQNNLLHYLPLPINTETLINQLINKLQVSTNQVALLVAASSEIFILLNLVLSLPMLLLRFRLIPLLTTLLTFGLVLVFVKLRFMHNTFTNNILKQYDYKITLLLSNPQFGPIGQYYFGLKLRLLLALSPLDNINDKKKQ